MNQILSRAARQGNTSGFFYGWVVVFAAAAGLFMGFVPIIGFTFSVFFKPIIDEFHWSRSEISLGYSLSLLMLSVLLPFSGKLVDRFGARRVIVPGAILFGLGLMAFTLLTNRLWQFYAVYLFIGLVGSGTSPIPYYKVISCWFERNRGLALGIAMGGAGMSGSIMPYFAHLLIIRLGWRSAYLAIGVIVIAVTVPVVALLLKEKPAMHGRQPNGDVHPHPQSTPAPELRGMTSTAVRHSGAFWLICSSFFLVSMTLGGCLVHLAPMLTDRGASGRAAALAASVLGIAALLGRVGTGYLLDRFPPNLVAMMLFSFSAAGIALLWLGVAGGLAFLAAFLVGMGVGAEGNIMAYIIARYFGIRAFGEIYGWTLAIYTIGAIIGPMLMAVSFDTTHSYNIVLGSFFAATLLAGVLIKQLGPDPVWQPLGDH